MTQEIKTKLSKTESLNSFLNKSLQVSDLPTKESPLYQGDWSMNADHLKGWINRIATVCLLILLIMDPNVQAKITNISTNQLRPDYLFVSETYVRCWNILFVVITLTRQEKERGLI